QAARLRSGLAALRDWSANLVRPRRTADSPADEQSQESHRSGGLWTADRRARADPDARRRRQPEIPADEKRKARPPARRDRLDARPRYCCGGIPPICIMLGPPGIGRPELSILARSMITSLTYHSCLYCGNSAGAGSVSSGALGS